MSKKAATVSAPAASPKATKKKKPAAVTPANSPMRENAKEVAASMKKEAKPAPANPMNAGYAPALMAVVATLVETARSAASAGLLVAERLAEAFTMEPHAVTGHATPTAWAHALLTEAAPMAGQSTVYAWIEAGLARAAVVKAGIDPALFPMDTLRVIGAKSTTGQDPKRMAEMAKALAADDTLRNGAGKVDPRKARAWAQGTATEAMDREAMIKALANKAKKFGGDWASACDLLLAAVDLAEAKEDKGGK